MQAPRDLAAARGALLVADEVYHPLYLGAPAKSAAARPEGALVVGDFSKALCLSGLRLGYLIDRDPERRERWLRARMHFTITSSTLGRGPGGAGPASPGDDRRAGPGPGGRQRAPRSERRWSGLRASSPGSSRAGGTTAFPWLTFTDDSRPFAEALAAEGVLVVPGDCFGTPRHFRVGFGACPDFPAALRILEEVTRDFAAKASMAGASAAAARS